MNDHEPARLNSNSHASSSSSQFRAEGPLWAIHHSEPTKWPAEAKAPCGQFAILFILLIAAFLRLSELPMLPPGLNFDEAGSGAAALEILSGSPKLWWRLGGGQEPLWPYLTALSTAILGNIPLALRLPAALISILSVAAVYPLMLTLRLGGKRQNRRDSQMIALYTALGLALSGWHLHFSRLGFRAILLPLFSTLAFYFFWRSLTARSQKSVVSPKGRLRTSQGINLIFCILCDASLVLSALFMALAIYSYLAARLLLLVPLLFLVLQWVIVKIRHSNYSPEAKIQLAVIDTYPPFLLISIFLFLLLLFLLPLIAYFLLNPTDFVARSTTVSIFNPAWNHGDLIGTASRTLITTLGTFIGLSGDPNPLVNLPGHPAIPPLLAPFFCLGLLISLYYSFSPASLLLRSCAKPPVGAAPSPHLFLLCWWAVMLLPAILAPEGAPHHLRLIGTIVPTYALIALGLVTIGNYLSKLLLPASVRSLPLGRFSAQPPLGTPHISRITYLLPTTYYLLLATCYLLIAFQTYTGYFIRWPGSVDFTLPFDLYAVRLAADMARAPANVGYALPMDIRAGAEARHYTIDYLLGFQQPKPYTYIPVDEHKAEVLLTQAAKGKNELQVVRWTDDKHREADAKEIVTYLLETTAKLRDRASFPVYDLETYALLSPQTIFALPAITQPIEANFDNLLRINAAFVPSSIAPGGWLPVALTLAPLAPIKVDYKASLRLISPTGERIAQKDRALLHNFHQGTSLWPPETVNEYYLLAVPAETPPGDYTVVVVIYHPDTQVPLVAAGLAEVPLGQVRIE